MKNKDIFTEHFRCSIELTERKSFQRVITPMVVGTTPFNPDDSVGLEKVCAIYITEAMLEDLINSVSDMLKEENRRKNNDILMDLFSAYKMMDNLYK